MPGDLKAAFAAIDAANAEDPTGKEPLHSEMAVSWVYRLRKDPPDELLLAARAHHIRRWEIPRSTYADGRAGYLKWKRDLQRHHADVAAPLLAGAGFGDEQIARVQDIIGKRGLTAGDPDVQTFEDALCLVFLETQLSGLVGRLDAERAVEVLRKTMAKMSDEAVEAVRHLELHSTERRLLDALLRERAAE